MLPTDDPHAAARIRAVLDAAGYRSDRIDELIGADLTALGRRAAAVVVHRTAGGTPLDTLVRLFQAGVPVPRADADRTLQGDTEQWAAWGLLNLDAGAGTGAVSAAFQLGCHGDLVLATDWGPATPNVATAPDHVMGFSPSTLTLARLTVRTPSRATLDLGTGGGLQALLAAAHSERVVATDVNPRAVRVAAFNAALNGLAATVDCRHGDLFQPLRDTEVFDSIVSNPPFVVSPHTAHLFMSGGGVPEGVCSAIARTAPDHLAAGGWCQFLANWAITGGEDWREHLQGWFDGNGCDVWVIRRERQPTDEYAALWIETDDDDQAEYARRFDDWMRWYDARGITSIDYGLVTMRRRGDGNTTGRIRCDDVPGGWDAAGGAEVAAAFARHDWLAATDDDALLDARLRCAENTRLGRELLAVRGEWVPVAARLRIEGGIDDAGGIDPHGERIVAACDGSTPLRVLLDGLAAALGTDLAAVAPGALQAVRRLVERGALLP
jgi:methylase of polypeptide subunit release factors